MIDQLFWRYRWVLVWLSGASIGWSVVTIRYALNEAKASQALVSCRYALGAIDSQVTGYQSALAVQRGITRERKQR